MKNKGYRLIFGLIIIVSISIISACNNDERSIKIDTINSLEQELFENKNGVIDSKDAANMIHAYTQFADEYPTDSLSPKYLFKAADVSINIFHSQQTILLFDRIINEYPTFEKVPQALFLKAFTYENYLLEKDSAKQYYQLFLKKYPQHSFSKDAEISIQNIGKSPEEIIKAFKK